MPVPGEPLCTAAFAFAVPDARGEAFLGRRSEEAGVDRRAVVLVKCDYSETVTIRMPREKPTSRGTVDPVIVIRSTRINHYPGLTQVRYGTACPLFTGSWAKASARDWIQ